MTQVRSGNGEGYDDLGLVHPLTQHLGENDTRTAVYGGQAIFSVLSTFQAVAAGQDPTAQQKPWDNRREKRVNQIEGFAMPELQIEYLATAALRPYPRNARTHSKKQIKQIADSIRQFGFTNPLLIDKDNMILAGHGRLAGAQLLAMDRVLLVPWIVDAALARMNDITLTEEQRDIVSGVTHKPRKSDSKRRSRNLPKISRIRG
jgi:hypothetical protein